MVMTLLNPLSFLALLAALFCPLVLPRERETARVASLGLARPELDCRSTRCVAVGSEWLLAFFPLVLVRLPMRPAVKDGGGQKTDGEGGGDTGLTRDRSGYNDLGAGGAVGVKDRFSTPQLLCRTALNTRGEVFSWRVNSAWLLRLLTALIS